jgi:hypothetical protein
MIPHTNPITDPCELLTGSLRAACEHATNGGSPSSTPSGGTMDGVAAGGLDTIARAITGTADWVLARLTDALGATSTVDFSNSGFVKVYALVFAASSVLTLVLWLIAVLKRALRGGGIAAAGEAIGCLWLSVLAAAFAPVVLLLLMSTVDAATTALAGSANSAGAQVLARLAHDIQVNTATPDVVDAGVMILVGLLMLAAGLLMWIELLIRAAALYVGGMLGAMSASALVDRDLWRHYRRWLGMIVALALVKPVLFAILDLAAELQNAGAWNFSGGASPAFAGCALLFLACFASWTIYRWVPTFGDDIAAAAATRRDAMAAGPAAAVEGPAAQVRTLIHTRAAESVIGRTRGYGKRTAVSGASSADAGQGAGSSGQRQPRTSTRLADGRLQLPGGMVVGDSSSLPAQVVGAARAVPPHIAGTARRLFGGAQPSSADNETPAVPGQTADSTTSMPTVSADPTEAPQSHLPQAPRTSRPTPHMPNPSQGSDPDGSDRS